MVISATFLLRDLASAITATVLKLINMMTRPQIMNMTEIRFCMILRVKMIKMVFTPAKRYIPWVLGNFQRRKIYKKIRDVRVS